MARSNPDAIALLTADHRAVEQLFEEFEATTTVAMRKTLASRICVALVIHTMIEEEIFYPALAGRISEDSLEEAYVEHDSAKLLVSQIMAGKPGDHFFEAKVKVLSEEIIHHVGEEERPDGGLFAQARKAGVDLAALGAAMAERKVVLKAEFEAGGLPAPTTRTLTPVTIALGGPVG